MSKNCLGAKSFLKGRWYLITKMNIIFFVRNKVSNSSSFRNFFENSIILWKNNEKKNFFRGCGGDIDISIFYVKTIDNTIETVDGFAKTIDSKNYQWFLTVAQHYTDHTLAVLQFVRMIYILVGSIHSMLAEELKMWCVCNVWVPHHLIHVQL